MTTNFGIKADRFSTNKTKQRLLKQPLKMRFTILLLATAANAIKVHESEPWECRDTDFGAVDDMYVGCSHYTERPGDCDPAHYDNDTFQAGTMCCACNGGEYAPAGGSEGPDLPGDEFPGATLYVDEVDSIPMEVVLHVDEMHMEGEGSGS